MLAVSVGGAGINAAKVALTIATRYAVRRRQFVDIVIAAVVWTIYWFARHSRQRDWLR